MRATSVLAALAALAAAQPAAAATRATVPGRATSPYPTLHALTLLWPFAGDANGNGRVSVAYRRVGDAAWRPAMPLLRVPAGSTEGYRWASRHAGSILGLAQGTRYEVRLVLRDPDGGSRQALLRVATRTPPRPWAASPVRRATPATLARLLGAVRAGDTIELGAGTYGGFTIDASGTAARPIVVRGTAGAVVRGEIGIFLRRHVILDRLRVVGRIRFNGSDDVAVTRSVVHATRALADGIITDLPARRAYIADNVVVGTTPWRESSLGADGANLGEGILVTGPGHVVEHNLVRGFRDDISLLEDQRPETQYAIDIEGNDIRQAGDDAVEADFCAHDCRVVGNRVTDAFVAFSSQPGLGGPTYFARNAAYNIAHVAFKLYRGSTGDVLLHNTVVKGGDALGIYAGVPVRRVLSRDNLLIGGPGGTFNGWENGSGRVIDATYIVRRGSSLDFDGLGSTTGRFEGKLWDVRFASLAELRSRTTERHAVRVGLGVFAARVAAPRVLVVHAPQDLRLRPGAAAVDAGVTLPNLDDGATGRADLGAYELGAPLPRYGPR